MALLSGEGCASALAAESLPCEILTVLRTGWFTKFSNQFSFILDVVSHPEDDFLVYFII